MEFILRTVDQAHTTLKDIYEKSKPFLAVVFNVRLTTESEKRSLKQNDLMWGLLTDLSNQVEWHGMKLSPYDWKHMITASLKKQRIILGIDGHMVVLGASTSKMTKEEMSNVIEATLAFGATQGVQFREFEREEIQD